MVYSLFGRPELNLEFFTYNQAFNWTLFVGITFLPILWLGTNYGGLIKVGLGYENRSLIALSFYTSTTASEHLDEIKQIVESTINTLKDKESLSNVKFCLVPLNSHKTKHDIDKYFRKNGSGYKHGIWFKIDPGKEDGILKYMVSHIHLVIGGNTHIRIGNEAIHLIDEFKLRGLNKKLFYSSENSLLGRKNLAKDSDDLITYFIAIYHLCKRDFNQSRNILRTLYNPKHHQFTIHGQTSTIKIGAREILGARLAIFLVYTYLLQAETELQDDNYKEVIQLLLEGETMLSESPFACDTFIILALCSYKTGDIHNAKSYTNKIAELAKQNESAHLLNNGFFAIIDGDTNKLLKNYRQLTSDMKINPIFTVAFLEDEKDKYPTKAELFEYAISLLTLLFIDKTAGKQELRAYIDRNKLSPELNPLVKHFENILKKRTQYSKKRKTAS